MFTNDICDGCGHSIEDQNYNGSITLENGGFVNFVKCYHDRCNHGFEEYG